MGKQQFWTPDLPARLLPEPVRAAFRAEAQYLLDDMIQNKRKITTAPAPDPQFTGHKIKVVEVSSPGWYSDLYWSNPGWARSCALAGLKRIAHGNDQPRMPRGNGAVLFSYDKKLRAAIVRMLTQEYEIPGGMVPLNETAADYFKNPIISMDDGSWTPDLPIAFLPLHIQSYFSEHAASMLEELCDTRGKGKRHFELAGNKYQPRWFTGMNKERYAIRRKESVRALERISRNSDGMTTHGRRPAFRYDFVYRGLIKRRLSHGFEGERGTMPANIYVHAYFDTERRAPAFAPDDAIAEARYAESDA